jgi:hypothetical protein
MCKSGLGGINAARPRDVPAVPNILELVLAKSRLSGEILNLILQ